jgi:hypothetical protein
MILSAGTPKSACTACQGVFSDERSGTSQKRKRPFTGQDTNANPLPKNNRFSACLLAKQ